MYSYFIFSLLNSLRTVFFRKIQKMHLFPKNWMNRTTNGTIRKYFPRAFEWMVMSVGFDNLKIFWWISAVCPALGHRVNIYSGGRNALD
jgi:hypothetical protein